MLSWAALAVLLVVFLVRPQQRAGLGTVLQLACLLVVWFFLARTKTLAWQTLAALFAAGLPWALVIGLGIDRLAAGPGWAAATERAALVEVSLALVPLLVLALVLPARIQRFAVVDWLLAGFVLGLALEAMAALAGAGVARSSGGGAALPGLLGGGAATGQVHQWHVQVALVATSIGFAVAGWRHARRPALSPAGRIGWRAVALLTPAVAGWLAVSGLAGEQSWLLPALLLVAVLVDAGRLRNAAELAEDPLPHPFAPTQAADRWAGRFTRWAGTRTALPVAAAVWVIAAGCAAVAYVLRDLLVVLAAYRPDPQPAAYRSRRESRWSALARGRAAGVMVRAIRAEAIRAAAGPATRSQRRAIRLAAAAGLTGVLITALALVQWAGGPALAPLWAGVGPGQLLLLGLGGLALLVLAAGPLDLWSGGIARSAFLSDRMAGAPEFGLDPAGLARAFLLSSTPADVLTDAAGAVLTVFPAALGGRTGAGKVRDAVHDFVADPERFIAARRAAAEQAALHPAAADDTAPIRIRNHADLPPVKLADGRVVAPMSDDDERLFIATLDDLVRGNIRARNEAAEYQVRIYGDDERLISHRPETWSDGHNTAYGTVADAVYYDGNGPCWYAPETVPESIRHKAYLELDRRLIEYATAVYYPASPFRALEVTTNHPLVAQALEQRMARLAIPGYVVLEP